MTTLYNTSLELSHLLTRSSYTSSNISPFPPPLTSDKHHLLSVLSSFCPCVDDICALILLKENMLITSFINSNNLSSNSLFFFSWYSDYMWIEWFRFFFFSINVVWTFSYLNVPVVILSVKSFTPLSKNRAFLWNLPKPKWPKMRRNYH